MLLRAALAHHEGLFFFLRRPHRLSSVQQASGACGGGVSALTKAGGAGPLVALLKSPLAASNASLAEAACAALRCAAGNEDDAEVSAPKPCEARSAWLSVATATALWRDLHLGFLGHAPLLCSSSRSLLLSHSAIRERGRPGGALCPPSRTAHSQPGTPRRRRVRCRAGADCQQRGQPV